MCLFTSALRASVNKLHIPSLPQNNLYLLLEIDHTGRVHKKVDNFDTYRFFGYL